MKPITMFVQATCPYCRRALAYLDELFAEHPEWKNIPLVTIDEHKQPDVAEQYDYWYVPTFYVDGKKLHEGAASKADVSRVLEAAYL